VQTMNKAAPSELIPPGDYTKKQVD
jgi:hypothetical protein